MSTTAEMENEAVGGEEYNVEFFGDKEVRWYQLAAVHGLEAALEEGIKRICLHMPTGTGKTITMGLGFNSPRVRKALKVVGDRPLNVLFIAHTHRLLTQAERTYAQECNINMIMQSPFSAIPEGIQWDLSVIDECHHEAMHSIQLMLERIGDLPIIGLTATPDRADGAVIKFERLIAPISRQEAVEQGFLAATRLHSIVSGANRNKTAQLKQILTQYACEMGQTMVFVSTKKEVEAITSHLLDMGYRAIAVLNQSGKALDQVLDDFSDKKIQFIVNCNKINEGVDVKGCTDVVLGRTYGSYPQLNQVIGRAARPDSACNVWEMINPLSGRNLDTTVVVGTPEIHRLLFMRLGRWIEKQFGYIVHENLAKGNMDKAAGRFAPAIARV